MERVVLRQQVKAFNASHREVQVKLVTLPQGDYNARSSRRRPPGNLPDVLDFDGPILYNYAWSGKLKPIDSCLTDGGLRGDLLPSLVEQGTYAGRTWGVGTFDSGLGLFVRTSILERAGIRIPRAPDEAWTVDEFDDVLRRLREAGYRRPLDLKLSYLDAPVAEWPAYGFAPAIWSAGGDLIDRDGYRKVDGVLNGPEAVRAMETLRRWVAGGYVDPDRDGTGLREGPHPDLLGRALALRAVPEGVRRRHDDRAAPGLRERHGVGHGVVAVGRDRERDRRRRRLAVPLVPAEAGRDPADDERQRRGPGDAQRDPPVAAVR